MTPASARLAPLGPRDQLVQPLPLRLQLLDDLRRGSRVSCLVVRLSAAMPHAHHHPVATVAPRAAAHEQPPESHHAHHHQGADQHQQQYRYPYRPFHLCAPSSARPDSCSLFPVPYLFAISYSSISSLISSSSRPSRMPEATQVWRWPSRINASIFSMARRTAYVCLRTSGQYLSSWIMRRTPARRPSLQLGGLRAPCRVVSSMSTLSFHWAGHEPLRRRLELPAATLRTEVKCAAIKRER